jgi:drug/metabolite transporter (DMT)-like permease
LGAGARTLTGDRRLAGGFAGTGVLLVALGAAVWGTDTVLRAPLSAALAPVLLVLGEHLVLAVYAVPAVLRGWRELWAMNAARWGALLVVGWGGSAVATILFTTGLFGAFEAGGGSVNTVLLLQQTQPLFAIAAAAVVLGERLTVLYVPIFAVAALGAYLLAFGDLEGGLLAPFTQVGGRGSSSRSPRSGRRRCGAPRPRWAATSAGGSLSRRSPAPASWWPCRCS